jgi:hypothetical protein
MIKLSRTTFAVDGKPYGALAALFLEKETAVAQGITVAKGAKGAGPIQPGLADFVTTGGLVTAERFQF